MKAAAGITERPSPAGGHAVDSAAGSQRILIDQGSDLPVHEGTSAGGFWVVYGDAFKEPKIKK